jgi:N-acetylmuramoyl-L-alanine amidase
MTTHPIIWKGAGLGEYAVLASPRVADRIVIHRMLGTLPGTDAWFALTPAQRGSACSSADFGIGVNADIHQYVSETNESYAEGINFSDLHSVGTAKILKARWGINPNSYCYSIEHEGFSNDPWPEAMRDASAWLIADLAHRHGIPLDRDHILGHGEIYAYKAQTCPGPSCPFDDLIARATVYLKAAQ